MGLEERQMIAAFQSDRLPHLEQSIVEAAGFKIELDIDWDAIAAQGIKYDADKNDTQNKWESVYFSPLIEALKAVNTDDHVVEALRSKVKKVSIICTGAATLSTGSYKPEFKDGTLTIDDRKTNCDAVRTRSERIRNLLEVIIELTPPKTPTERVAEEMGKLKSSSVNEILSGLQYAKNRSGDGFATPWLTLSLSSGKSVEGNLLDYPLGHKINQGSVLMIDRQAQKLVYVHPTTIESVTVNLDSAFGPCPSREDLVFAKGEVVKVLGNLKINPAKIPGRMQVVRQASSLAKMLSDKFGKEIDVFVPWEELPDTENTTISVSLILDSVKNVIEKSLTDNVAYEAINEKVSKIDIQIGERKQVILERALLSVCVEIKNGDIDFPTEANLSKMMNDAL